MSFPFPFHDRIRNKSIRNLGLNPRTLHHSTIVSDQYKRLIHEKPRDLLRYKTAINYLFAKSGINQNRKRIKYSNSYGRKNKKYKMKNKMKSKRK